MKHTHIACVTGLALFLFHIGAVFAWTKDTCVNTRISSAAAGSLTVSASAGNLLVFMVEKLGPSSNSMSGGYPTDSNGTINAALAYTEVAVSGNHGGIGVYYELTAASGPHVINVSFASNGNFLLFGCAYGYSGTASLDTTASSINTGIGTLASTNSLTPAHSGDLLLAQIVTNFSTTFSSWTNGFVQEDTNHSLSPAGAWADLTGTCSPSCSGVARVLRTDFRAG